MTFGIPTPQFAKIRSLFASHRRVREACLFGSRAQGNFREGSDIDIALKGDNITARDLTEIEVAYEKLYLPWKLDLVVYHTISNTELKNHIDRVGITIHPPTVS